MHEKFTQFITSLAEDPNKLEAFQKDPDAVLNATELTVAEKVLLKSGNPLLIREAIAADLARDKPPVPIVVICVWVKIVATVQKPVDE